MRERLDFKRRPPSSEERFAAEKLRELANQFYELADKLVDDDEEHPDPAFLAWRRAAGAAVGMARDLDWEVDYYVRVPLTVEEAEALSDLMDEHPDASYGSSWRNGYYAFIDWGTYDLVLRIGEWAGHMQEAIGWMRIGRDIPQPLLSITQKIQARRKGWLLQHGKLGG